MNRAEAMLKVVQDVYDGGKDLIPGWQLLEHAKDRLKCGGPDGLKRYYELCLDLNDHRGRCVKATLERNGSTTLESEYSRFIEAYRSCPN